MGSSPLTRGKHVAHREERRHVGLIPTHAGKTSTKLSPRSLTRAHPRSRGENRSPNPNPTTATGSSPLTRGKQALRVDRVVGVGLIPADAGKTSRFGDFGWGTAGSSPLTRGKPESRHTGNTAPRLIPAHAGKTDRPPSRRRQHPAHPHSRGKNSSTALIVIW